MGTKINNLRQQTLSMSDIPFSYEAFEATRDKLIREINSIMTEEDRKFLIGFEELTVNWKTTPYSSFKEYPSVNWKIQNLQKLKASNPKKLQAEADKLRRILKMD